MLKFCKLTAILALIVSGCSDSTTVGGNSSNSSKSRSALSRANPFGDSKSVDVVSVDVALDRMKVQAEKGFDMLRKLDRDFRGVKNDASAENLIERMREETNDRLEEADSSEREKIYISFDEKEYWEKKSKEQFDEEKERGRREGMRIGVSMVSALSADLSFDVRERLEIAFKAYLSAVITWGESNIGRVYFHHDPASIAYVVFGDLPRQPKYAVDGLRNKIKSVSGVNRLETITRNGKCWIKVLPVDNFKSLVNNISIGSQTEIDEEAQIVSFSLSPLELNTFEKAGKKAERERQKKIAEQQEKADQKRVERAREQVQEYLKLHEDVVEALQAARSAGDIDVMAEEIIEIARTLEFEQRRPRLIEGSLLGTDTKDALQKQLDDSIREYYVEIDSELTRIRDDPKLRRTYATRIGANIDTAKKLLRWDGRKPTRLPENDSSDPDYVIANLEIFQSGNKFEAEDALNRLTGVDPKSVDSKVRKEVAKSLRDYALTAGTFERDDAVKALTHWGGKFSVPILIEMLNKSGRGSGNEAIFQALAQYPTHEGAEAVADFAADFFNGKDAINCLSKMGAVAEDALIRIAPTNNYQVSRFAVRQLGKVGTAKSLPILKKAKKSSNREIVELAKSAIKAIEEREPEE